MAKLAAIQSFPTRAKIKITSGWLITSIRMQEMPPMTINILNGSLLPNLKNGNSKTTCFNLPTNETQRLVASSTYQSISNAVIK